MHLADAWYCAHQGRQIGPLALQQMQETMLHMSEPESALVWRAGFSNWMKASDVAEFSALTLRPPPVPPDQHPTWRVSWWWYPVPFIAWGVGSQIGRKVMAWNHVQRRKAKALRR
ncbi:DUF4339 domain-containing protein [Bradyrhizobium sp. CCBAU 45321]|uniref:DUF4339 domain-containing protein n=1 Tax=Bradyrhizobium sp. CCBAU 45321 TaxID=1641878 RepID=UPI003FA462B0